MNRQESITIRNAAGEVIYQTATPAEKSEQAEFIRAVVANLRNCRRNPSITMQIADFVRIYGESVADGKLTTAGAIAAFPTISNTKPTTAEETGTRQIAVTPRQLAAWRDAIRRNRDNATIVGSRDHWQSILEDFDKATAR